MHKNSVHLSCNFPWKLINWNKIEFKRNYYYDHKVIYFCLYSYTYRDKLGTHGNVSRRRGAGHHNVPPYVNHNSGHLHPNNNNNHINHLNNNNNNNFTVDDVKRLVAGMHSTENVNTGKFLIFHFFNPYSARFIVENVWKNICN